MKHTVFKVLQHYRAFFEEHKNKKHYPYYYIIKYNRKNVKGCSYRRLYSYQDCVLFDELAEVCKHTQYLEILKIELKIYGRKYYFKSWDDVLVAIKMNKIWGIKYNENNN